MANSTVRVTKKGLLELLKDVPDKEHLGYLFSVQDGKEGECHQVLVFFKSFERVL